MENLVVATFQNSKDANSGLNKLRELDQIDDITLYNMVMIQRKDGNKYELIQHDGPDTRDLPATGALAGTLIGAIAGPIGLGLGLMTGAMLGSMDEDDQEEFNRDFLDKVNRQLLPGTIAIVMDVEEDQDVMINSYLEPFHGQIVRTRIVDQYDRYNQQQWKEFDKEIDDEEKELKKAREEDKAAIKAKIKELKAKRDEKKKQFKAKMDDSKKHMQAKIKELEQKAATAQGKMKDKIKARKQMLKQRLDKWNKQAEKAMA